MIYHTYIYIPIYIYIHDIVTYIVITYDYILIYTNIYIYIIHDKQNLPKPVGSKVIESTDGHHILSPSSWTQRGWCRAERTIRELSQSESSLGRERHGSSRGREINGKIAMNNGNQWKSMGKYHKSMET